MQRNESNSILPAAIKAACLASPTSDGAKTIRFRPALKHLATTKFVRRSIEPDTSPFVRYSAPYELIDIQEDAAPFVKVEVVEPHPLELVATTNLVGVDTIVTVGSVFETEVPVSVVSYRPILIVGILLAAFALGLGVPFLL
jgi:hypothetical protein